MALMSYLEVIVRVFDAHEVLAASRRLMLICLAATRARSFSTSSAKETAHLAFRPALRIEVRSVHGPSEDSYFSNFFIKSRSGSWQASAMPRIAFTWLTLSSVGSNASRCLRTFFSPSSSTMTCWYSVDAPPESFRALLIFLIRSGRKSQLLLSRQV